MPRAGLRLRVGRVGPKSPTMCQAGGVQRNCQLAAAALLSSAALQYTVPIDAAVCASATSVRCQVTTELLVKSRTADLAHCVPQVAFCWAYSSSQTCVARGPADARSGQQVHALLQGAKHNCS